MDRPVGHAVVLPAVAVAVEEPSAEAGDARQPRDQARPSREAGVHPSRVAGRVRDREAVDGVRDGGEQCGLLRLLPDAAHQRRQPILPLRRVGEAAGVLVAAAVGETRGEQPRRAERPADPLAPVPVGDAGGVADEGDGWFGACERRCERRPPRDGVDVRRPAVRPGDARTVAERPERGHVVVGAFVARPADVRAAVGLGEHPAVADAPLEDDAGDPAVLGEVAGHVGVECDHVAGVAVGRAARPQRHRGLAGRVDHVVVLPDERSEPRGGDVRPLAHLDAAVAEAVGPPSLDDVPVGDVPRSDLETGAASARPRGRGRSRGTPRRRTPRPGYGNRSRTSSTAARGSRRRSPPRSSPACRRTTVARTA